MSLAEKKSSHWKAVRPYLGCSYTRCILFLLPLKHFLVLMMLKKAFEDNYHEGTEFVRCILQQEVCMIDLWNTIRSFKHKVVKCHRNKAQSIQAQTANLPKDRLNGVSYPCQNTWKVYSGPYEVTFLRKTKNYWCCLSSCLITPAVFIEVVEGLDTSAYMMTITRLLARRGRTPNIVSDNGTSFAGVAPEFQELASQLNQTIFHELLHSRGLLADSTPLERPISELFENVRLENIRRRCNLSWAQDHCFAILATTVRVVEQTLNPYPINPVSDDPNDLEIWAPDHFLLWPNVIVQPLLTEASRCLDCLKMCKWPPVTMEWWDNNWLKRTPHSEIIKQNGIKR